MKNPSEHESEHEHYVEALCQVLDEWLDAKITSKAEALFACFPGVYEAISEDLAFHNAAVDRMEEIGNEQNR